MGFGFALLIQLVLVFVLSLALALQGLLIVFFIRSRRKGRLFLFVFFAPFITCYTFYFSLLIASLLISQAYGVDEGIGDIWYVPLIGESRLEMIDLPETASILKGDKPIVDDVVKLYQNGSELWGKTDENSCFTFNGDTLIYERESVMVAQWNQGKAIAWEDTDTFYQARREAITGKANNLALAVCLGISLIVAWLLKRIILGKTGRKAKML